MADHIVLTWDCRQQPDLDMLASAVREISGERCHIRAVDTDSDQYAIEHIPRPKHGICGHCRKPAYIWAGRVACVDRTAERANRYCPGNGQPPARVSTSDGDGG